MSRSLAVRPVEFCRAPSYPGVPVVGGFPGRRYAGCVLERMRRGLARPLVVFGLYSSIHLGASADDSKTPDPPPREGEKEPRARPAPVRTLSATEVHALVADLERAHVETAQMVKGDVAGQMGFLTEEEGRALLAAFFEKNGFRIAPDVRVRGDGLDLLVDGFDAEARVGFEYLGPRDPHAWNFEPGETDASPAVLAEIELARARRERAILVLDGRNYAYDVESMDHLPAKSEAIRRLLEDVRRFLVWVAEENAR